VHKQLRKIAMYEQVLTQQNITLAEHVRMCFDSWLVQEGFPSIAEMEEGAEITGIHFLPKDVQHRCED